MQDNQGMTDTQYDSAISESREIFLQKTKDYGTSWRVYRTISVADQIYIKAKRIRNIQEKGNQKINDDIQSEFRGILNYAIIGLIQLSLENANDTLGEELPFDVTKMKYDTIAKVQKN